MLMCLAEALLRIPDADTADKLIRDKIVTGNWQTDQYGRFPDRWGALAVPNPVAFPQCAVTPSCVTDSTQTIYVAGKAFTHSVTWSCYNVQVGRQ